MLREQVTGRWQLTPEATWFPECGAALQQALGLEEQAACKSAVC